MGWCLVSYVGEEDAGALVEVVKFGLTDHAMDQFVWGFWVMKLGLAVGFVVLLDGGAGEAVVVIHGGGAG